MSVTARRVALVIGGVAFCLLAFWLAHTRSFEFAVAALVRDSLHALPAPFVTAVLTRLPINEDPAAWLVRKAASIGFFAIVGVLVQANTLSTRGIVIQQGWHGVKSIFNGDWYWLPAIVALVIFVIAAVAETNHPPFDLVEAEQELTGGFFTEYTGIKFAIFYLAEFMNVITMCAIAVTLFFGGPNGPGLGFLPANGWFNAWIMPVFWFLFKVILLLFGTVWLRASLPRLRYDQLMALGWKVLIEVAFLWVMISGVVIVAKEEGWSMWIVLPSAIVAALAVGGILYASVPRRGEVLEEIR